MPASPTRRRLIRLVVLAAVGGVLGGGAYLFAHRHTYHVVVRPGQSKQVPIEVPMQRLGRSKSFAKERRLPVECTISEPKSPDGLRVSAVHTSHTVHKLRARVQVAADRDAEPGRRKRRVSFTIAGEAGWPKATIVVEVKDR